ncbi:AAA family ATPase [Pseudomonas sp. B2M1-30]|uniref:AAA family ATPase n=1 Tax=Pseudomonas TaxID=286 RepID=UPI0021C9E0D9|nr:MULTISPECIES: AAA family ATPase [Pseudomonas]MCU0118571.1 AAA family ATPase [Pseudomonas sp. B2M1-30]MCU7263161.1 AAA family ATPase [Pseudomonas koreensis]
MDILAQSALKESGLGARLNNYRTALDNDDNEAQTRFHVIDSLLNNELDWKKDSIRVEPYIPRAGYADYALVKGLRCRAILEAKRDTISLVSSNQTELSVLPLTSIALNGAQEGIEQALRYAAKLGAPIGIVTNGNQWIGFLASRADGLSPQQGLAVVFPTIDSLVNNWSRFYEFFSDIGLEEERLSSYIREKEIGASPISVNYFKAFDRSYKRIPSVSDLGYALEEIFRNSFIKMNNHSMDILVDCFVETKASEETDIAFEKILEELLGQVRRVQQIDSAEPEELQALLETSVELKTGEFVLLVGNKGSGKTTFLQRFFQKKIPKATKDQTTILSANLLKIEGSLDRLTDWLSNNLIDQAERALFGTSTPSFDDLRGAFWNRYQRMRVGELAPLYERDRDAFRQRFGEELRSLRLTHPREYLLSLLKNSLAGRKRLPVLIIDNVDHLPRLIQDSVFQYAIGISSSVASFIVCPVTDTTVWSLTKAGPLQSLHSRAFFLPVPSLREVFSKRLDILRATPSLAGAAGKKVSGVVGQGWKLEITDLESFCTSVEAIFVSSSEVTTLIGKLCNYDVRRSLELAGSLLASPWIGLEELLRLYVAKGETTLRRTGLLNALILQKGTLFDEDKHSFLLNIFARPPGTASSPFMALYILRYLMNIDEHASNTRDKFVRISELWSIFSALLIPRETFRHFMDRLFAKGLLECYDPSEKNLSDETLVRISPAGAAHYKLTLSDNVYISQMALVTLLERENIAIEIREEAKKEHPGWLKICRLVLTELIEEDSRLIQITPVGLFAFIGAVRQDLENLLSFVSRRPAKSTSRFHS